MNELALFAGVGGGILGGHLLGWRTVCAVERDGYAADVLIARQNDGSLPTFPIWDDVRSFDGRPWRGCVDVVSGGFPCQDISVAGKGTGINGAKSGLWREFARIIGEVEPSWVFIENSPQLVHKGLDVVLKDLNELGYDAEWGVLGAAAVGATHRRERLWIVAHAHGQGQLQQARFVLAVGEWLGDGSAPLRTAFARPWQQDPAASPEPGLGRLANGVAHRMDRLRCHGNGQVPAVAAAAWTLLAERMTGGESEVGARSK